MEVIATFLPRIVLDSIFTVLEKSGLELVSITLEPIAAINAIIPQDMRHLNILLVDVGAGTSDLALTKQGVVFAYGMVPEAGDEITEKICEDLLVDFNTGERIKRLLLARREIEYYDIWGKRHSIKTDKIKGLLGPRVKALADSIAKLAVDLNDGIPQAVVGVGGGSLTYNLITELANSFTVSTDKVGIRKPSAIKRIRDDTKRLTGPDSVTPLGIAMMTASASGLKFIDIKVNNKKLRMLDFYQKKDILGALILAGIDNKKLYPHPGLAITIKINGQLKIIKGTMGKLANILLNGKPVSLSCKINSGDVIEFRQAEDGKDPHIFIGDLLNIKPVEISLNRKILKIIPRVIMNDKRVALDALVVDRAEINIHKPTLADVLINQGIDSASLSERQILVNINKQPRVLTQRNFTLRLNGEIANLDREINDKDVIEFYDDVPTFYNIKDIIDVSPKYERMLINIDGRDMEIEIETVQIFMNGRRVKPEEFVIDGADIKVYYLKEPRILLSEIFKYVDVDPQRLKGKTMKLLVNDKPAGFTTPLADGSRIRIIFEDLNKEA